MESLLKLLWFSFLITETSRYISYNNVEQSSILNLNPLVNYWIDGLKYDSSFHNGQSIRNEKHRFVLFRVRGLVGGYI